jgi:surface antigen
MGMRFIIVILGLAMVAGCVAGPDTVGRYDPQLYNAEGQVVAAVPPPPPPAPAEPPCREVARDVTIGGQMQHAIGTACRQPDGTWRFSR